MKKAMLLLMVLAMVASATGQVGDTEEQRRAKQAELDAVCEVAREKELVPLRAKFVEECVENKQRPDRASCEVFYADYGARTGNRAPLFYDLPECVTAHEYSVSSRRGGN